MIEFLDFSTATKMHLALVAVFISLSNLCYYIYTAIKGRTKPHAYTWMTWGIISFIVALAQIKNGGGFGGYYTLLIALSCFINMSIGFAKANNMITRNDTICLFLCLLAIPVWLITNNALWSVLLVTAIDIGGFIPTIRKSYGHPFNENRISFFVYGITFALSILALNKYSLTTVFYPAIIALASWGLVAFLSIRRYQLRHDHSGSQ